MLEKLGYDTLKLFFEFILVWVVISYFISPRRSFGMINSSWGHLFPEMQFSTKEFYASVEESIQRRGIPDTSTHIVVYSSGRVLTPDRRYLQIKRDNQMILVCAAPFGRDFFISWRSGETLNFLHDLVPRIPAIGTLLARLLFSKTFFELDTDSMFKEAVKECVLEVIDNMTNAKGIRGLTDLERQSKDMPLKSEYSR